MKADRRPRKTALDKAIENLDAKIAALHGEIKALELARQHLVETRASIRSAVEAAQS
jgi:prefoldin subunit 5